MICADQKTLADGAVVFVPAAVTPADPGTCAAVLLQGADVPGYSWLTTIPGGVEAGQVYVFGMSLVIVPYLFARAAGAVLGTIR